MRLNFHHSEETKQKMKGRIWKKESLEKMSNTKRQKNFHFTDEQKEAMSKYRKEHPYHHSEETKQKMRGRHLSEETKEKIRQANIGKKYSIELRKKLSEIHINLNEKGSKGHNWRGGLSFEKYSSEWNNNIREKIRYFYNYTCQVCNKQQIKRAFHIHHIDYNKKNCEEKNLICLCIKCHTKTNFNRDYWTKYFNNMYWNNKQECNGNFDYYYEICEV